MATGEGTNGRTAQAQGPGVQAFCEGCGADLHADSRFCGQCGRARRDPGETVAQGTNGAAPGPGATSEVDLDLTREVPVVDPAAAPVTTMPPPPPPGTVPLLVGNGSPTPEVDRMGSTADGDDDGGRDRRRLMVIGGSVAGGLLLVLLAALLLWPDGSEVDITETVDTAAVGLSDTVDDLPEATLIEDFNEIGAVAAEQAEALGAEAEVVDDIGDDDLRAAAGDLLDAEIAALAGLGDALATMKTANLPDWEERIAPVEDALEDVAAAQDDFADLELEEFEAVAVVDVDGAEEAIAGMTEAMQDKLGRYNQWVGKSTKVEKRKEREQAALIVYGDRVAGLMDDYAAQRDDLQDFTDRIDVEFVSIQEGVDALAAATAGRQRVLAELNEERPPAALASAHTSLVAVVGDAVAGVQSAQNGLTQYLNDPFYLYFSVEETPGWQEFQSASGRITTSFDSALAGWQSAVDAEASRLRAIELPKPPKL